MRADGEYGEFEGDADDRVVFAAYRRHGSCAARTLAHVDSLIVEYWPAGLLRMGDSAEALQRLLHAFPYCALLEFQALDQPLRSPAELFAQMAFIPTDGSDEGFFDIVLSRRERLPLI